MNKSLLLGLIMIGYLWSCAVKPKTLGINENAFSPCSNKPNCVCSQADASDKQHFMPAWELSTLEEDKAALKQAIKEFGNTKLITGGENYWHYEFTTGWMKYIDDVEFFFDLDQKKIHFKSASRVGYSDMGVNRKRMTRLKELFDKARAAR